MAGFKEDGLNGQGPGYSGIDFGLPPETEAALAATSSLVLWQGNHTDVQKVCGHTNMSCHRRLLVVRVIPVRDHVGFHSAKGLLQVCQQRVHIFKGLWATH